MILVQKANSAGYKRLTWSLVLIASALIAGYAIQRDIKYNKIYSLDLRNRVVGARLVEDGHSPYFYKWKREDGVRYYDIVNFDDLVVSDITVSPYFLHLLRPIADWPMATLSTFWRILGYLMLLTITLICWQATETDGQKQTVLFFSVLFLLTNAWKQNNLHGQCYLWQPFLASLFYWCLRRKTTAWWGGLAGLIAVSMVLIRISCFVFLLPAVLLFRQYKRGWLVAFGVAPVLLGAWILLSGQERKLWQDYSAMLSEQIRSHQGLPLRTQQNEPDPRLRKWEGLDLDKADALKTGAFGSVKEDNANAFFVVHVLFRHYPSIRLMECVCVGLVIVFSGLFYIRHRPFRQVTVEQICLLGFSLYMLIDLFSPVIFRHEYPGVQWTFLVLLAAASWRGKERRWLWLIFTGLLMCGFQIPYWKMRNTTGEYLFLAVVLLVSVFPVVSAPSMSPAGEKEAYA